MSIAKTDNLHFRIPAGEGVIPLGCQQLPERRNHMFYEGLSSMPLDKYATAKKWGLRLVQLIFLPWGASVFFKYCWQRLAMVFVYPAQSYVAKLLRPHLRSSSIARERENLRKDMMRKGYFFREVTVEKNGCRYSGFMLGKNEHAQNGQWVLQAQGNSVSVEESAQKFAEAYGELGFSTLFLNGPGVGESEGEATPDQIGEAQQGGIELLEFCSAKKIVIAGFSLGAAAVGKAIEKHKFRSDIQYLVIRQMAFNNCSTVAEKHAGRVGKYSIIDRGLEMDNVQSSMRLQQLDIPEIIIQSSKICQPELLIPDGPDENLAKDAFADDGVIPADASLGYSLIKLGITRNKKFRMVRNALHEDSRVISVTKQEIQHFKARKKQSLN